jgi:hypothetical protein
MLLISPPYSRTNEDGLIPSPVAAPRILHRHGLPIAVAKSTSASNDHSSLGDLSREEV